MRLIILLSPKIRGCLAPMASYTNHRDLEQSRSLCTNTPIEYLYFFRAPVNYANESNVPIMQASDFEQDEFPMRFPLQNAQRAQRESDFLPLRPLNER